MNLEEAISDGHTDEAIHIINDSTLLVNKNIDRYLMIAASTGNERIVIEMIRVLGDQLSRTYSDELGDYIESAISMAIQWGYLNIVHILLENGFDPDVPDGVPLILASQNNDPELLEMLLDHIDIPFFEGDIIHHINEKTIFNDISDLKKHKRMIKLMIERGVVD